MEIYERAGEVELRQTDDFDPVKIFECGQCFRWNADEHGIYTGVALGRAATVRMDGESVFISGNLNDFNSIWHDYFDFSKNYAQIRTSLQIDDYMKSATEFGKGIRILAQDRWEALCSFIISQCNNIPRIKKIIESLCQNFGEEIHFNGQTYYDFPSAEKIAAFEPDDLAVIRSGYRAAYIISAARRVASGNLDLDSLAASDFDSALSALKTLDGVGDKVANCVILFSLRMADAFPIDVWMKKAISEHYPNGFDPKIFGDNAGIAQQYMFYYQRSALG